MAKHMQSPPCSEPIKISGRITSYICTREYANFVFTENDQNSIGAIAIAAALAGQSGAALSTAASASSMEEEADYVQFNLGDKPVKGWVWRSPFKNGDDVEVAGTWADDHFECVGIARPADRIIALYPHCSRGSKRHIKNAFVLWLWVGVIGMNFLMGLLTLGVMGVDGLTDIGFVISCLAMSLLFGAMAVSLGRKWMPFVRLAEKVFKTLGWAKPGHIDLVKSSSEQRKDTDSAEFGTFYFRY